MMKVEFDAKGEFSIIRVSGEVDISNFKELESSFDEIKELANQNVLLDLTDLDYIDSSGVGALVRLYRVISSNEGTIGIYGCKDSIEKNFRLIRLDNFFSIYENLDGALSNKKK